MEYNDELQKLLISYMLSDKDLFVRTNQIIKPSYWNKRYRTAVEMTKEHYENYKTIPTFEQIRATTGNTFEEISIKETVEQTQWYFDTLEKFCKHKAMENLVIEEGPDLIKNNNLDLLVDRAKESLLISLQTDLGTEYFKNPKERLENMRDRAGVRSTGWPNIDNILYGGFERGTLNIFAGGPGCCTGSTLVKIKDLEFNTISDMTILKVYNTYKEGKYEVSSPDGYVPVVGVVEKLNKTLMKLETDGKTLTISDDHLFQLISGRWVYAKYLQIDDLILAEGNTENKVTSINVIDDKEPVYDLSVDHVNHRYYTNGLCSHNTGKSLFMQNICLNWCQQGLNVLYLSLELKEDLIALRFDAMTASLSTKEIMSNIDESATKLSLIAKKHVGKDWGNIWIKKMPESATTINNIKAYIKEFEGQTGKKIDAIAVDYLDLLRPNNDKINLGDLFVKDKYVSEELRALADEFNIYCVSASQLGRTSVETDQFNASHIAGGISKINTADNLLGIYTNPALKSMGQYQIQFMKTRTSAGVGKTAIMQYNNMTMRITAVEEETTGLTTDFAEVKKTIQESTISTPTNPVKSYPSSTTPQNNNKDVIKGSGNMEVMKMLTKLKGK